jgi:hypothetical protein
MDDGMANDTQVHRALREPRMKSAPPAVVALQVENQVGDRENQESARS